MMLETHRPKIYKKCFSKMEVACLEPSAKTKKKKNFFLNRIQNSEVLDCCIEK